MWKRADRVIGWDVKSYYAYLPALIIERDAKLDFIETKPEKYRDKMWPEIAPNGNKVIMTTMGLSMLYFPFFAAAHVVALITNLDAHGYSGIYVMALLMSSLFYLILGFILLRNLLRKFFSEIVTGITLLLTFFATNLHWYSQFEATMSHSYNFALFAIFLWLTDRWHNKSNLKYSILTGLCIGFITLIRPTNAIIALVFVFYNIVNIKQIIPKFKLFLKNYKYILIIAAMAFAVIIPQLIYWKYVTGNWFFYSYGNKGNFFFKNPQIYNGLFSYRKGWLVYTPVMILALIGFIFLFTKEELKKFALAFTTFIIINIYVIFSWWSWWYGGGLGMRSMIDSYALLTIPMAGTINYLVNQKLLKKIASYALIALFFVHGIFQTLQYYYGAIHWDSMTKKTYWDSFLRIKPSENFYFYVIEPNYADAMIGKEIIKTEYESIFDKQGLLCDAETIDSAKNVFVTNMKEINVEGIEARSKENAFQGEYSVKLNQDIQFGFTTTINSLVYGDVYIIKVKRLSDTTLSSLVIQAENVEDFYDIHRESEKIADSEWQEIKIKFNVPKNLHNKTVKVYCYNNNQDSAYFDNLQIDKICPE